MQPQQIKQLYASVHVYNIAEIEKATIKDSSAIPKPSKIMNEIGTEIVQTSLYDQIFQIVY